MEPGYGKGAPENGSAPGASRRARAGVEGGPVSWWVVGAMANTVILGAYLWISSSIATGLVRSRQSVRDNPLAWATATIFFTCAVHHGSHPVHQLLPYLGIEEHTGVPMRAAFDDWHVSAWDVFTAAVAIWYWTLRNRYPALVRGAALFEDIKVRQRQALEIHDNVVQGLATAKLAFETNDRGEGMRALETTLSASKKIITDLLGEEGTEAALTPGEMRRRRAATVR